MATETRGTSRVLAWGARLALCALGPAAVVGLAHCASGDEAGATSGDDVGTGGTAGGGGGGVNDAAAGGTAGSGLGGAGGSVLPPEQEIEGSFLAPVVAGKRVWSANPESGRVALVDAETLAVRTVQAGFQPTYLAAAGSGDSAAAVVLNVGSHDATVLRATPTELTTRTLPTHRGANAWAVSPGGRWAIAWTDASGVANADPADGFQDVTVLDLTSGAEAATRLTVGYRPVRLAFSSDDTRAFAVTEPGISVIELTGASGPEVVDLVALSADPIGTPAPSDVTLTPDGTLALVRWDGATSVAVVSVATGAISTVELGAVVTDLDLTADGTRAVAVLREASTVAVLPIPGIHAAPGSFAAVTLTAETFGSVALSRSGEVGLLFTNAIPSDRLTILDFRPGAGFLAYRTVALKSNVRAVFAADDAAHGVALLQPAAGSTKAGAFSLVPTDEQRAPKIVGTDAIPVSVVLTPGVPSDRALVTVRDDSKKTWGTYLVRFPTLQVDYLKLAGQPLATGMVPEARKGFVAQQHPEGRITFIDLEDGTARTLTGFELGAKVID